MFCYYKSCHAWLECLYLDKRQETENFELDLQHNFSLLDMAGQESDEEPAAQGGGVNAKATKLSKPTHLGLRKEALLRFARFCQPTVLRP